MSESLTPPKGGHAAPMSVRMAALVTVGIVLLIISFVMIGAAFGLVPLYAGFLLLWYFGSIDVLDMRALPALAIGAVGGTLVAWLLQYGLANWGPSGTLPAVLVIIAAIFLSLVRKLPMLINPAFMLYLTVMSAPLVQTQERFDRVLVVVAVATVYFGGVVFVGRKVIAAWKARAL